MCDRRFADQDALPSQFFDLLGAITKIFGQHAQVVLAYHRSGPLNLGRALRKVERRDRQLNFAHRRMVDFLNDATLIELRLTSVPDRR